MSGKKISQEFRFYKIDETRNHLLEEVKIWFNDYNTKNAWFQIT